MSERSVESDFDERLSAFLAASPTPFHATRELARILDAAGWHRLGDGDALPTEAGSRFYLLRNGSSIVAVRTGAGLRAGLRMVGAHTDSPCLRLKPTPELRGDGMLRVGVETYGGVLLNPWFDRDLSLAGRVHYRNHEGALRHALIDFRAPVATIPSLAIHLDREANQNRSVNPQKDIPPLLATLAARDGDMSAMIAARIEAEHPNERVEAVLDHELCFYDANGPAHVGIDGEFLASARLDNLLSCFCGAEALVTSDDAVPAVLVCNDHEEVGSASTSGAAGPFLRSVLERLAPDPTDRAALVAASMLVSADNAHAVHPSFADRHDGNHGPALGGGPVVKINANQRYASNSATQALFRHLCEREGVPLQTFVTRTDLACGSTIGPITATEIGVRTLDVGIPQLAMHSIRELCHRHDPPRMVRALRAFQSLSELPALD